METNYIPIMMAILSVPMMVVFVFFMVKWTMKSITKKLTPLQMAFGGELMTSFWKGYCVKFLEDGIETKINLTLGGRNSPPTLYLQKVAPLNFNLMIFKENILTRGLNKLGALHDMKVGIPSFDEHFHVQASEQNVAMNYLHDNARYALVEQFFQWGFTMFQGSKKVIQIAKSYYQDADLEPDQMRLYLAEMKKLMP